jgi:hypothetical protein
LSRPPTIARASLTDLCCASKESLVCGISSHVSLVPSPFSRTNTLPFFFDSSGTFSSLVTVLSQSTRYHGLTTREGIDRAVARWSLLVLIYRLWPHRPDHFLGLVEEVGKEDTRTFRNVEELWEILNRHRRKKPRVGVTMTCRVETYPEAPKRRHANGGRP